MNVYVAKRYDVAWDVSNFTYDDIFDLVDELNDINNMIVVYEDYDWYEFNINGLKEAISSLSEKNKKLAEYLLATGDKRNTYIRVEISD